MNATQKQSSLTGDVLEIQRMSTEDGPGLRTTVFFKGCGLRCAWCHNPESLERKPQVQWIETKCIFCKMCLEACPHGALSFSDQQIVIDRDRCEGCGSCADICPSTAMELLGKSWTVEQLVGEVMKDASYFKNSGGITASGGEAALQALFVSEFFKELKHRGVHTALDTSGLCPRESLEAILPYTDLVLYDIKEIDPIRHREFTGAGNELILENLLFTGDFIRSRIPRREMWIRTPVIPGATDRGDNIAGIGAFVAEHLNGVVTRWELCAFNNLCRDKYRRLGTEWQYGTSGLMKLEEMEALAAAARRSGIDPDIVRWSGSTELEEDTAAVKTEAATKKYTPSC
jgi:pyruvate formate lyase activating enzyme